MTNTLTDNLPLSGVSYGDVVAVTVTPFSGTAGTPVTTSATVVDHAPTATVTLDGAPARPADQLSAHVQMADVDGDTRH